jgi:small subunit ribosomal protein S12e
MSRYRGLTVHCTVIIRHHLLTCRPAEDCNQPDYKKLIEALCAENNVSLLSVPEAKQLGQWAGLCKIDAEGEPRKV